MLGTCVAKNPCLKVCIYSSGSSVVPPLSENRSSKRFILNSGSAANSNLSASRHSWTRNPSSASLLAWYTLLSVLDRSAVIMKLPITAMFDLQSRRETVSTRGVTCQLGMSGSTYNSAKGRRGFPSPRDPQKRWRGLRIGEFPGQCRNTTSHLRMRTAPAGWKLRCRSTRTQTHNLTKTTVIILAKCRDAIEIIPQLTINNPTGPE